MVAEAAWEWGHREEGAWFAVRKDENMTHRKDKTGKGVGNRD